MKPHSWSGSIFSLISNEEVTFSIRESGRHFFRLRLSIIEKSHPAENREYVDSDIKRKLYIYHIYVYIWYICMYVYIVYLYMRYICMYIYDREHLNLRKRNQSWRIRYRCWLPDWESSNVINLPPGSELQVWIMVPREGLSPELMSLAGLVLSNGAGAKPALEKGQLGCSGHT